MRRGNKKASQSEGWADRMSASAMRPGNLLSGFQGGQRGVSPAMRRGNKKASQSEGWADRMSASAMRPGNLL
ncbi:hypothetical protein CKQ90_35325, partial [Klebsiella pneumoniae]